MKLMMKDRSLENIFFFAIFALVAYLIWEIIKPFVGVLALAAIIATVCHPIFLRIVQIVPRHNRTSGALLTVLLVLVLVFVPLMVLGYALFQQVVAFYDRIGASGSGVQETFARLEAAIHELVPGSSIQLTNYAQEGAQWVASHVGAIFAGTASTVFFIFVMLVALFYFLRDGSAFTSLIVRLSPLPDEQDTYIVKKLGASVRSVVLGTLTIALLQGLLTALGFAILRIEQPILWGSVAAIGALIPGVGTSLVFLGAIIFSLLAGNFITAALLAIWGSCAVGLIDNLLGPYLMSRGGEMHPFLVLLSVLGGITLFGPVGFLIGPVVLSLFMVLLELYNTQIRKQA